MALATKRSDTKSLFEEAYEFYVIRSGLCVLLEQFLTPETPLFQNFTGYHIGVGRADCTGQVGDIRLVGK